MRNWISGLLACFVLVMAFIVDGARAEDDFLPPEKAFQFSARMADAGTVQVSFKIADGYYLYRDRLGLKAEGATLGEAVIPRGKIKFDPNFEKDVETFRHELSLRIPVQASGAFMLKVEIGRAHV